MSEVVNQDAASDAAERPAMETVPHPMVSDASNGNPQATSGGTLQGVQGTDGVQGVQGTDGVQDTGNVQGSVQGNVQGTTNVLQNFLYGTPQANRSATGANPNLANQFPSNGMQTQLQGLPATPMTQQSIAAPLLQPPIMGGISAQGSYVYAWTGGEPNASWTGLKNPNVINKNPLRLRSNSVKAA